MREDFLKHLSNFSGRELPALKKIYAQPAFRGIRINPLKTNVQTVQAGFDFKLQPTPFCKHAYYLPHDYQGIGHHPLHHAGAIYVQEPSAGAVLTAAAIKPGERVLDLCAAPGGKSTGFGAALKGQGLLWSNEYVKSRAAALLSNLERFGIPNAVVSNMDTGLLCTQLPGFFDVVLVDAPCSGEGMCRHNPEAVRQWSLQNIKECVPRQRMILKNAVEALRVGGRLIYSTCTFNPQENEENVAWLLNTFSNIKLQNVSFDFGEPGNENYSFYQSVCRIFPDHGGEGHFIAVFEKTDGSFTGTIETVQKQLSLQTKELWQNFCKENLRQVPAGVPVEKNGRLYLVPENTPKVSGAVLRFGVLAGEVKGKRFEPAHALFNSPFVRPLRLLDLALEDPRLPAFLHGEQLAVNSGEKGYVGVCVCGAPLGFGKQSGGVLKNHYPKGLRD